MYIINYNEWRRVYEETEAVALQSTVMLKIQAALGKRGKSLPDLERALATLKDTIWNTLTSVSTNLKSIYSSLTKSIASWRDWPIIGSVIGYLLDALGWVSTNISYCVSNMPGVKAALLI